MKKRMINLGVEVLPLTEDFFPIVDHAIEAIKATGIHYEVGPLETVLEGDDLDELLAVAKAAHLACFESGVGKVVTVIKIADAVGGTTIEEKGGKYRRPAP